VPSLLLFFVGDYVMVDVDDLYNKPRYFVLVQRADCLDVVSRHMTWKEARAAAESLHTQNPDKVYGAAPMSWSVIIPFVEDGIGPPKYQDGDLIDPDDIAWSEIMVPASCSLCCHPFVHNAKPDSLDFRCTMLANSPMCDRVNAIRVPRAEHLSYEYFNQDDKG